MSLVSKLPPEEREIPHEPGNHMSFRVISARLMEDVEAAGAKELVEKYGNDIMQLGKDATPEQRATARKGNKATLGKYSPRLLLRYGLASMRGPNYGEAHEPSGEEKDDLDPKTDEWARMQILDVSGITEGEAESSAPGSDQTNGTEPTRLKVLTPSGLQS